ncbi:hypothetical protein G6F60_003393 [Rhizopus arrhizus]|nr:hypothetical protein G6F60_003393 [Rhizopus arrhizus]
MGKSGSGKTSMRSIIFSNYIARDTRRLGATIDVEHSNVKFLGNLVLNLWDCGGQEAFMENYFASQRDRIFKNVEVLIYVFDVESRDWEKDLHYYQSCLEAILANSKEARIFCLIHKMDLVPEHQRDQVFEQRVTELQRRSEPLNIQAFRTSIWDETLYAAWSKIVHCLIPNIRVLESHLNNFCRICDADEVVLFERTTFLVIATAATILHQDHHRFEKISNIIKQFNLGCSRSQTRFKSMEIRGSNFTAFIDVLTNNTYVMIVINQHHFNTYDIALDLEKQSLSKSQAAVLMKGMKFKLRERLAQIEENYIVSSDFDNDTYFIKSGLSELKTEIQMMKRQDVQILKADKDMLAREVDTVAQRLNEQVELMKNEITLELNNKKNETRMDHQEIDIKIQELNNKLTIKLSEFKMGLESVRLETIWKGLAGVAAAGLTIGMMAYALSNYTRKRKQENKGKKLKAKKQMQEEAHHAGFIDMEVVYSA